MHYCHFKSRQNTFLILILIPHMQVDKNLFDQLTVTTSLPLSHMQVDKDLFDLNVFSVVQLTREVGDWRDL